jgi:ribonuclease HI
MPRRRKKKDYRIPRQSTGPLPWRYGDGFAEHLLVFSDASQKRNGGLAAVLFADPAGEPLIGTRTVPWDGSNELELQAALFGLQLAQQHFPFRSLVLFSDNQDAVTRLKRARESGLQQDPGLAEMFVQFDLADALAEPLANADVYWVKGHSACRGNTLADQHASKAAA